MFRRLIARWRSRKATTYQRCLAVHMFFAQPRSAMK